MLSTSGLSWLLPVCVYAAAVLSFALASPYSRHDFPLDDAWIHRVYSQSFAYGHAFQYNHEGPQEAGSTSPLWAIVSAPAHWLDPRGVDAVVLAVKAIALLLGCVALYAVVRIAQDVAGSRSAGAIAGVLFGVDPRLLFSTLSGMENVLLVAVWLCGTRAYMARQRGRSLAWFSLAPVCRPEATILLPLWLVGLWWLGRRQRPTAADHCEWLLAFAPLAVWSLFCHMANGHWLPTTFYLKATPFHLGRQEVERTWEILTQYGYAGLGVFVFGLAVLSGWAMARRDFKALGLWWYLVFAPVLYAVGVGGTRPVFPTGYYWTRWIDPASLILTAAFCIACGIMLAAARDVGRAAIRRSTTELSAARWCLGGLGAVTVCWMAGGAPRIVESFANRRSQLASDSRAIHLINVRAGEWIRDHTPTDAHVGVNDAGAIRYIGGRWTLDLMGLNSADVAFEHLSDRDAVDWLAVFPSWFAESPTFQYFQQYYEARQAFDIPLAEYTVCHCPGQTRVVILQKKVAPAPDT
jgi:hypothetical protein